MSKEVKAIGIDLGTTFSVIAYVDDKGMMHVIPNSEGDRTTPSVVCYTEDGEVCVGKSACELESLEPTRTFRSFKRFMGTNARLHAGERSLSPEQVSSEVLRKLKADAESHFGYSIESAVITVPAYFDSDARQATITAGKLAGLNVLRVISEPTAAAIAYGLDKGEHQTVLVYDLGGGTLDVTILKFTNDGVFDVIATSGNTRLGGDDIDAAVADCILLKAGLSGELDPASAAKIRGAAERAKRTLSGNAKTTVVVDDINIGGVAVKNIRVTLERSELEDIARPIIMRSKICVDQALRDARMSPKMLDEVVFVGGSTRMPLVAELVGHWTDKTPNKSINPDEAVALGASMQAANLSGNRERAVMLIDVVPLTLGVAMAGDVFSKIIERNSAIPTESTEVYTTLEDDQTEVAIRVHQGERPQASTNKLLGEFKLEGIPAAPAGNAQIEVTFDVDVNAILHVTAKDLTTGTEKKVTIKGSSSLSPDEVEKLVRDAEANKSSDRLFIERAKALDKVRQRIIQVETLIREAASMLGEEMIEELMDLLVSLKDALGSENTELHEQLDEAAGDLAKQCGVKLAERAAKLLA